MVSNLLTDLELTQKTACCGSACPSSSGIKSLLLLVPCFAARLTPCHSILCSVMTAEFRANSMSLCWQETTALKPRLLGETSGLHNVCSTHPANFRRFTLLRTVLADSFQFHCYTLGLLLPGNQPNREPPQLRQCRKPHARGWMLLACRGTGSCSLPSSWQAPTPVPWATNCGRGCSDMGSCCKTGISQHRLPVHHVRQQHRPSGTPQPSGPPQPDDGHSGADRGVHSAGSSLLHQSHPLESCWRCPYLACRGDEAALGSDSSRDPHSCSEKCIHQPSHIKPVLEQTGWAGKL